MRRVIEAPPQIENPDGSVTFVWERPQYVAWRKLKAALPADVDRELLHRALVATCAISGWGDVDELPPALDDAIVRLGEHFAPEQAEWTFILTAFRAGRRRPDRSAWLRRLLSYPHWLGWVGQRTRAAVVAMLAEYPELLEGARVAFPLDDDRYTSYFIPLLAADGTPDSLDLLLPMFEAARTTGEDVDWIRAEVVPLLPDNKHVRAFIADFDAVVEQRTLGSPARDFLVGLGQAKPPKVVKLTLTFKDARDRVTFAVKADSTKPHWLFGRRNAKWQWSAIAPDEIAARIPPETRRYILLCGAGVERARVDAWARTLMPGGAPTPRAKPKAKPKPKAKTASTIAAAMMGGAAKKR